MQGENVTIPHYCSTTDQKVEVGFFDVKSSWIRAIFFMPKQNEVRPIQGLYSILKMGT